MLVQSVNHYQKELLALTEEVGKAQALHERANEVAERLLAEVTDWAEGEIACLEERTAKEEAVHAELTRQAKAMETAFQHLKQVIIRSGQNKGFVKEDLIRDTANRAV